MTFCEQSADDNIEDSFNEFFWLFINNARTSKSTIGTQTKLLHHAYLKRDMKMEVMNK